MPTERTIEVEIIYALRERQHVERVTVAAGSTAREAILLSTLLERFPEIDLNTNGIGIYSRLIGPDDLIEDGDRVEIYRPLEADPKAVRRRLAGEGKTMGRSGRDRGG